MGGANTQTQQPPMQSIDVTRGADLNFKPMQPVAVGSSRPELVSEAIAGAIQGIGTQGLSSIAKTINSDYHRDVGQSANQIK
jgi:hypothetical protein